MSQRRCPRCQSVYAAPARFCTKDGAPLVDVAGSFSGGKPVGPPVVAGGVRPPARHGDPRPPVIPTQPPDAASVLTGSVLDARYQIERKIGEGGMAYVYLASELTTGERLAIKVLSPRLSGDYTSIERLKLEAGVAMRLDHPNICRILRLGQSPDGLIYLVMPFLDGEVLNDREARTGQFSLVEGLPLLVQVCRGLQHAHDLGILHRDLKPENIMLVPDAEAPGGQRSVVMDFGLAKELVQDKARRKLTTTGIVLGTPEFMSPEQIRGKPLDARSDIYALGIVAFEIFAGDLPFDGKTSQDTMIARLRGQPTMLRTLRPDLPPRLEGALARALAMDPANRFPTMDAFGDALEAVIEPGLLGRLFRR